MKVNDVMTRDPLTVEPDDTIREAEELMTENDVRQLPVVKGTELAGIITDRDIRSFLGGRLLISLEERERAMNTKVGSIMSTQPITVSADDDLRDVIETLIEEKVGGIPVVNEEEGLIGIVTYVDVLRCFLEQLKEE